MFTVKLLVTAYFAFMQSSLSHGQSNYASQANSIEYSGNHLPEEATLDGKVTKLDDLSPIIFLNRTKAALNCGAGSMQVDLKFNEKFYGIAYADFDRNSACQIIGKGDLSYRIELPLKGCGTKQEPQRVFSNNIVVRFHPGLEMDGDEIITIVCRYPPPIAPTPPGLNVPVLVPYKSATVLEPPLKGIQILFIICAIMFLTLLLLGLGVSYYCLRRRPIIVRRLPVSVGTGSEITKLSGSSLGNISAFEGVKIPRLQPPMMAIPSSSGSEGPLISVPSDYPSESDISSAGSFENHAFVQELSSICSEQYAQTQHEVMAVGIREGSPKFNVQVNVKRTPPASLVSSSDSESIETPRMDRNNLSTIMESHEDRESILTVESLPKEISHTQFTYTPELHPVPKYVPPEIQKLVRTQQEYVRDDWSKDFTDRAAQRNVLNLASEVNSHSIAEYTETVDTEVEPPISVVKKPETTQHIVDDVFLKTIKEKSTIENVDVHKRKITEYKVKPESKWDVTIRNYPTNGPEWEDFSDVSSSSGLVTPKFERANLSLPPTNFISETVTSLRSPELVGNMKPIEIPPEDKSVKNWNVLIRVLQDGALSDTDDASSQYSTSALSRQLSYEDKTKWRDIITTESTLRTMLLHASIREDFERIRQDVRYEKLFEPESWDVIIRILAPPDNDIELRTQKRKGKREVWDTRSRRSSLPTLYEYDSDGSSVRTITNDIVIQQQYPAYQSSNRSRRTSRSSYRSDHIDMRSMSEVTVDFGRPETIDNGSEASSLYPSHYYEEDDKHSIQRSLSQPSLARSASEFTERWIAPEITEHESLSPENSPHGRRRLAGDRFNVQQSGHRTETRVSKYYSADSVQKCSEVK